MASILAQKASLRGAVAARPARASRATVVVRASAEESRRAVLGSILGAAVLSIASTAQAVTPVDLLDDRAVRSKGFDLIYEAREIDLPQATRDGFTQARGSLDITKKRVKESEDRIDSALEPSIKKAYWTEAREELRRQIGTLRFDLNTLASQKPKAEKKKALELRKEFFAKIDALDFALRSKDQSAALPALENAKAALDSVLASVL